MSIPAKAKIIQDRETLTYTAFIRNMDRRAHATFQILETVSLTKNPTYESARSRAEIFAEKQNIRLTWLLEGEEI